MHQDSRIHKKQSRKIRYSVYSVLILLILVSTITLFFSQVKIISPIPDMQTKKISFLNFFKREKNPEDLKERIKKAVNSEWTNYSVLVKDLHSPFTASINESLIYNAASVNKVPILSAVYDMAKKGEIDFDKIITILPNLGTVHKS